MMHYSCSITFSTFCLNLNTEQIDDGMTMLQESEACHQVAERMARQALEVR